MAKVGNSIYVKEIGTFIFSKEIMTVLSRGSLVIIYAKRRQMFAQGGPEQRKSQVEIVNLPHPLLLLYLSLRVSYYKTDPLERSSM